jgi:hypothetical protein
MDLAKKTPDGFQRATCDGVHHSVMQPSSICHTARSCGRAGRAELIADAGTAGLLTRFPSMSMGDRSWQITSVAEF